MTSPEFITLRTGQEVLRILVTTTMISLRALLRDYPLAFYELVQLCRNPEHYLFGNAGERIEALGLTQNGQLHEAVREIVLAATEGEGFDIYLVSPMATGN